MKIESEIRNTILWTCVIGVILCLFSCVRAKAQLIDYRALNTNHFLTNLYYIKVNTNAGGTLSNWVYSIGHSESGFVEKNAGSGTNIGIFSTNASAFIRLSVPDSNSFSDTLIVGNGGTLITTNAPNPPDPQDVTWNGKWNTFVGIGTGLSNTSGNLNTFVGSRAGSSNSIGDQNTFVGGWAGKDNTTGYHNTFVGTGAGQSNTTGFYNTFIGTDCALYSRTGDHNTASGTGSMGIITSGTYNNAFGSGNLGVTSGNYNSSFGSVTMIRIGSGEGNTAMGHQVLQSTTGNWNFGAGINAGFNQWSGDSNVYIGAFSDVLTAARTNLYNSMALGPGVILTTNNQIIIGNSQVTQTLLRTNVGIGTTATTETLNVAGTSTFLNGDLNGAFLPTLYLAHQSFPTTFRNKISTSVSANPALQQMLFSAASGASTFKDVLTVQGDGKVGVTSPLSLSALHVYVGGETQSTDTQAAIGQGLMLEANNNGAVLDDVYINFWDKIDATDNSASLGAARIRSGWADNSSWARTYLTIQTHGANTAQWSNTIVALGNKVAINPVSSTATPSAQLEVNGDIRASTTINATNGFLVGASTGMTTNINVLIAGGTTNQLQFTKGILTGVVPQ